MVPVNEGKGLSFKKNSWNRKEEEKKVPLSSFLPSLSPSPALSPDELAAVCESVAKILVTMSDQGIRVDRDRLQTQLANAADQLHVMEAAWIALDHSVSELEQELAWSGDGRLHPEWDPQGTFSGRLLSRQPAIQQLTKKYGMRRAVCPTPGHIFVVADWDHAQFRIAAGRSGDHQMLADLAPGQDLYMVLAELGGSRERDLGKALAMPMLFCGKPNRMVKNARERGISFSHKRALAFDQAWRSRFPVLLKWIEETGCLKVFSSPLGRTINTALSKNDPWKATAIAGVTQGAEADALRLVLVHGEQVCADLDAAPVILANDEVVWEVAERSAEAFARVAEALMQRCLAVVCTPCPPSTSIDLRTSWDKADVVAQMRDGRLVRTSAICTEDPA